MKKVELIICTHDNTWYSQDGVPITDELWKAANVDDIATYVVEKKLVSNVAEITYIGVLDYADHSMID